MEREERGGEEREGVAEGGREGENRITHVFGTERLSEAWPCCCCFVFELMRKRYNSVGVCL